MGQKYLRLRWDLFDKSLFKIRFFISWPGPAEMVWGQIISIFTVVEVINDQKGQTLKKVKEEKISVLNDSPKWETMLLDHNSKAISPASLIYSAYIQ